MARKVQQCAREGALESKFILVIVVSKNNYQKRCFSSTFDRCLRVFAHYVYGPRRVISAEEVTVNFVRGPKTRIIPARLERAFDIGKITSEISADVLKEISRCRMPNMQVLCP